MGRSPEALARRTGFRVKNRIQEGDYINVIFERA